MKELDEDEEYKNKLKYILNNMEKLLNNKKQSSFILEVQISLLIGMNN